MSVRIDATQALKFVAKEKISAISKRIPELEKQLLDKTGAGNDFLGWIDLPEENQAGLISKIKEQADQLKKISEIVVVIGIGGSYLGSRAVIEALGTHFYELQSEQESPLVLFAGQNISDDYHHDLLNVLDNREYSIIVISKSGTTTEPAIAFRLLKEHLIAKYGEEESPKRIVAITDREKGALKTLADKEGYPTFVVPDDVGGRFSVLSPVGLLPIALAGFDISKLIDGAAAMRRDFLENKGAGQVIRQYAALRNALYEDGKTVEVYASYNPKLAFVTEWLKQLYGESEGKEQKGIFPAGVNFTTDLHSLGQYIQDGLRMMFETVITVENPKNPLRIPEDEANLDGLNYIAGKTMSYVNHQAKKGTMMAHVDGGVPNIEIIIPEITEFVLGELIWFFEMACAISGYILQVNPFDQPGVEDYKRNMFRLLGKPGF